MSTGKLYIYIYTSNPSSKQLFDHRKERWKKKKKSNKFELSKITLTSRNPRLFVAHFENRFHTRSIEHDYYYYPYKLPSYFLKQHFAQIRDRIIPIISNYFEDIGARGSKRERGKDPRGDEKGTRFRLHGVQVEAELTRVSANKGDHFESVR